MSYVYVMHSACLIRAVAGNVYSIVMNIDEVEAKVEEAEKALSKIKELIADMKVCSSEISKNLIASAVKKIAASFPDLKVEG